MLYSCYTGVVSAVSCYIFSEVAYVAVSYTYPCPCLCFLDYMCDSVKHFSVTLLV